MTKIVICQQKSVKLIVSEQPTFDNAYEVIPHRNFTFDLKIFVVSE